MFVRHGHNAGPTDLILAEAFDVDEIVTRPRDVTSSHSFDVTFGVRPVVIEHAVDE